MATRGVRASDFVASRPLVSPTRSTANPHSRSPITCLALNRRDRMSAASRCDQQHSLCRALVPIPRVRWAPPWATLPCPVPAMRGGLGDSESGQRKRAGVVIDPSPQLRLPSGHPGRPLRRSDWVHHSFTLRRCRQHSSRFSTFSSPRAVGFLWCESGSGTTRFGEPSNTAAFSAFVRSAYARGRRTRSDDSGVAHDAVLSALVPLSLEKNRG
jgi:hypothetical protein